MQELPDRRSGIITGGESRKGVLGNADAQAWLQGLEVVFAGNYLGRVIRG